MDPASTESDVSALARRRRTRIVLVLLIAVAAPIGASVLYTFPPSEYSFYPGCPFHLITGLHCPGCGATRCVHALLHGDVPQALAYNSLFVLALPLFAYSGGCWLITMWTGKPGVGHLDWPRWLVVLLVGIVIVYAVVRNVPAYPFDLLAPHALDRS